jgi:Uma2 family endonuclease
MRVRVNAKGLYTYPDVVVVCGEPQFLDERRDTLLNPTLIVEVLSESTEQYDRGRKFEHYRPLESLAEYLLVSSERVSVERYTRQPDGSWNYIAKASLEDSLDLPSVGCHLALADLYEKVDFSPPEPAAG